MGKRTPSGKPDGVLLLRAALSHGLFLSEQLLHLLLRDGVDAALREDADRLVVVRDAEDDERAVCLLGEERVHVFQVDLLLAEHVQDAHECAGLILDLDRENFGHGADVTFLLEHLAGPQRTAPPQRTWITNLAGVLGGGGFALFFGCGLLDALVAAAASFLIITLIRRLSPKEGNPLILNFTISLLTELFIMLAGKVGLGEHTDRITIGVVMLLISGLGATNGLRDLVHLDTISGLINIVASVTGAIGIALGIALPILLFRSGGEAVSGLNPNVVIQLLSGTAACVGFAIWFRVRGIKVFYCALGTFLSWGTYLLAYHLQPNAFYSTLAASVVCGLYAQITARINKTPATIFTTICLLPLIPGSSLYYTVYGVVVRNAALSYAKGVDFGKTCFGIVLGFMVVEVANRFLWRRPH